MLLCLLLFSPPVGSVQLAEVRQKIDGFGGSIAYYGSYVTRNPYKQEIYKALFDPIEGLGVSLLRLQNLFRNQAETNFDPQAAEIVAAATQYRNAPITILMSSFSPPATLKSNGAEGCGEIIVAAAKWAWVEQRSSDAFRRRKKLALAAERTDLGLPPMLKISGVRFRGR